MEQRGLSWVRRVDAQQTRAEADHAAVEQLVLTLSASNELQLNGQLVAHEALQEQLRPALSACAPEQRVVFVVADEATSYAALVQAIAEAKRAGASSLGVVP